MIEEYFPKQVRYFLGIFAGSALFIGIIGAALRKDSAADIFLSGLEAAILAALGGFIARSFVRFLLKLGGDSPNAALVIGWGFFLWPGLIDTVARLFGKQYATRPAILLWIAVSVGSFSGMMDGMWQTHNWVGLGVPAFVLDETWGLAGTTNGDLLHLVNFIGGDHAVGETRTDVHRYNKGFAVKSGFAFTQGAVMSSNDNDKTTALFAHENTHVWQNRLVGPLYTLSYIGWMLLLLIPGFIYGLATKQDAITPWSYFNNPWEAMGYDVGESHGASPRTAFGNLIWSDLAVYIAGGIYFALVLALAVYIVYRVWFKQSASRPMVAAGYY
jgi:hypothetical protein